MTPEERAVISRERQKVAEFIASHPSRFYICEGCETILDFAAPARFCPKCGGYRFCYDRQRLLDLVTMQVKRPSEEWIKEYDD